jgi:hypothetical protein
MISANGYRSAALSIGFHVDANALLFMKDRLLVVEDRPGDQLVSELAFGLNERSGWNERERGSLLIKVDEGHW